MKKPAEKRSEPHWDYHEVIDYIEDKYQITTRGYKPKSGFPEGETYLDFWHWITDVSDVHNGCFIYLNLLGDYEEGRAEDDGDWDGDDEYRPRWVREIQKMIYDEFKPEGGEMKCWVAW